jgi:hypothetical protein
VRVENVSPPPPTASTIFKPNAAEYKASRRHSQCTRGRFLNTC